MRWLPILRLRPLTWVSDPLAALISLQTLQNALNVLGYPAVTLFVMIESSGIPFPGETMLLLASFYAAVSHQLQIPIVIACAAFGAIIGDNLGYLVGHTGGRALVMRYGKYVFIKPEHLDRAERFFAEHGNKTVFFGRFIAVLRAWAAFLAGVNKMPWPTFLTYNASGGILWATTFGTLGFYAGRLFHNNFGLVEQIARDVGWVGLALVVALILLLYFIYLLRRSHRTQSPANEKGDQETGSKATTIKLEPSADALTLDHQAEVADPAAAVSSQDALIDIGPH